VTDSFDAYEGLVLELAAAPDRLHNLRRKLQATRDSCALFDTPRFVQNLERAYEYMADASRVKPDATPVRG
jgi:predicted O-linked N-acetylglucosamine transferase (SPINDLY family)